MITEFIQTPRDEAIEDAAGFIGIEPERLEAAINLYELHLNGQTSYKPDTKPAPVGGHEVGLPIEQEPKYTTNGHAIVNRASGEEIPADEPVFIFRARDKHALGILRMYSAMAKDYGHREVIRKRIADFEAFANNYPERMKEPDTALSTTPARMGEE